MGIPSLITSTNFNSLGNDINIVGTFSADDTISTSDKYVSPILLNYVEAYSYQGTDKTLFYTEVNTNLKEGDRVFIINGNYDSNELIETDKYKKGRDGYKVLFVDYCKIALDIDYTGELPNKGNVENGDNMRDYIKVYYIDSYDSFLLANKQLSTRNGTFNHRFDYYQNNIAYIDNDYSDINDGWVYSKGITASPGFYVKNPTQSYWSSITTEFINSGSYSLSLAPSYKFTNNGKLKVMGKSFTYNGFEFQNGYVYIWDSQKLTWKIDVKEESTFTKAIISKSNFRGGDFKGSFNSGVYGSKSKKLSWDGTGIWNGGTLLNASWKTGAMNSKIILPISYQASIKNESGTSIPYQKVNSYNNGGYGFNYIIESEFESSSIYSAIIRNAKFISSSSLPVIENHIMSYTQSFDNVIVNGLFESSEFSNVSLIGGAVKNTRSRNSKFTDVKIINSFVKDSVITNSTLIADKIIKVDGYDELNNSDRRSSSSLDFSPIPNSLVDFKVYRFYIGEADFFKLRQGDSFYIKGLKIKNDKNVINFFDKKFTLGNWTEYVDDYNDNANSMIGADTFYKRGIECAAFLCTEEENEWIYNTTATQSSGPHYYTEAITENSRNENQRYSIDIFFSTKDIYNKSINNLNFDYATQSSLSSTLKRPTYLGNIDATNAYIIDSNIEDSYIEGSNWNSGFNINYNNDVVIAPFTSSTFITDYSISIDSDNNLSIDTPNNYLYNEVIDRNNLNPTSGIKPDDIIFLNSVDYYTKGKVLSVKITASGSNYTINDNLTASYSISSPSNKGYGLVLSNTTNAGEIDSVTILNPGLDYEKGDILYLSALGQGADSSGTDAIITINDVDTTEPFRIPDTYKVVNNIGGTIVLKELVTGTQSILAGLTSSGVFRTIDAKNRWNYLSKSKITNSKIKSGFFRRSYITNSLIQDLDYDLTDKDYNNMDKIKNLVLSDMIFSNNGNILSSATYLNSSLIGGTDVWNNGIVQNSILNGIVFNRGIIKESTWIDGIFNGGIFYNSRSFNASPNNLYPHYYDNRIKSYYKGGITINGLANNRYSWQNGTFNGGEFFKSDWENGIFNDGLFINSKWYNGVAKGGQFGDNNTATDDTIFYNGTVDYTIVNNANFSSDDSSKLGETKSIINWKDGIFNSGVFGSKITNKYVITQSSISLPPQQIYNQNTNAINNITFTTNSTKKEIKEININIKNFTSIPFLVNTNISVYTPLANLFINLEAPNGKIINIKGPSSGSSNNKLTNTIFSTSENYLSLDSGTQPYSSKFKIDNYDDDYAFDQTSKANTKLLSDLIDSNNGISGGWKLHINLLPYTNNTTYLIEASIDFITEVKTLSSSVQNEAIWNNGTFNGGQFIDDAVWKDGIFNGGKFLSSYGWLESGSYSTPGPSSSYSWQSGVFNGGEFGRGSLGANSTWYNGEFNYGVFKGRIWNFGVFRYGEFNGSGNKAIGSYGTSPNDHILYGENSYAKNFISSFTQSYYGLWRNGIVTNKKDIYVNDKKFYTEAERSDKLQSTNLRAKFNSVIWLNGEFNNPDGEIKNSVWTGGAFKSGSFILSSFNPYNLANAFNYDDASCYWENGEFIDSEFYYSKWKNGKFVSGTASGMIFENGTAYYMNAYNILWENGVWKNGNWNGSIFKYNGIINNRYQTIILNRLNTYNNFEDKLHIWNIFEDIPTYSSNILSITASSITSYEPGNVNTTTSIFEPTIEIEGNLITQTNTTIGTNNLLLGSNNSATGTSQGSAPVI